MDQNFFSFMLEFKILPLFLTLATHLNELCKFPSPDRPFHKCEIQNRPKFYKFHGFQIQFVGGIVVKRANSKK